jgi:hypothetical protein
LRICIATIFLSLQRFSAPFLPGLLCRFLLYRCLTELFFLRRDCFGGVIQFPSAELQFLVLGVPSTTAPGVSRLDFSFAVHSSFRHRVLLPPSLI